MHPRSSFDYASYHRAPGNQATHLVGIPLIVIAVLGLLGRLPILGGLSGSELIRVDAGTVVWALGMLWYLKKDWRLAIPFAPVLLGLYFVGRALPVTALIAIFLAGWAFQYVGHYVYEKKAPAFYKNAEHLLVGPFWIFAKVVGYRLAS
jgi:uncharacterized membrane protein YGL010W